MDNYRNPKLAFYSWTTTENLDNTDFSLTTTENQNRLQLDNYRKPKTTEILDFSLITTDFNNQKTKIDFSLTTTEIQNWPSIVGQLQKTEIYQNWQLTWQQQKTKSALSLTENLQLDNYRKPKLTSAWQLQKIKIDFSLTITKNENWFQLDNNRKPEFASAWQLQKIRVCFSFTTTENQSLLQLDNYRNPKLTSAW